MSSSIIHVNATGDAKAPWAASPLPFKLVGLISDGEFRESITRCNRALAPGLARVFLRVLTALPILGWPAVLGVTFGTEMLPIFAPAIYMPVMMLLVVSCLGITSCEEKRRQRKFRAAVERENDKYNSLAWRGKDGAELVASKPRISWGVNQNQLEIEIGEIKPRAATAPASASIAEGQPMLPQYPPLAIPSMQSLFPQFAVPAQGVPMQASRQALFLTPAQYGAIPPDDHTHSEEGREFTAQDALLQYTSNFSANHHQASAPSSNEHCAREGVCAPPTIAASAPPAAASGPVAVCPGCFHAARHTDRFCSTCGAVLSQKPRTPSPPHSLRLHPPAGAGAVVKSSPSVL